MMIKIMMIKIIIAIAQFSGSIVGTFFFLFDYLRTVLYFIFTDLKKFFMNIMEISKYY